MEVLPEECQFLGPEHQREADTEILKTHLETLFLLATRGGVEGKRLVRERGTYAVIRELHLRIEDEGVRRGVERLVDVLMGDEVLGGSHHKAVGIHGARESIIERDRGGGRMVGQADVEENEDEDNQIVPIF